MNLMHTHQLQGIRISMNTLMQDYQLIEKAGDKYYVPSFMFYEDLSYHHYYSKQSVKLVYGSNADRVLSLSKRIGDIFSNAPNEIADIICIPFENYELGRIKDSLGPITPYYMDNMLVDSYTNSVKSIKQSLIPLTKGSRLMP